MKIQRWTAQDLGLKLETVTKKINQKMAQIATQDPTHIVEQLQEKAGLLFKLVRSNLLASRQLGRPIPLTRSQVRKKVQDNLEEVFQNPEIIELVTDSIYQAAQQDPRYRQLLNS
ncbi:MAG: hypothetical protein HQM15_01975 [Deltaproteobacteria bacterium]|nr:hypothetical protein [Deltaproteobacteria bacterium]